MSRPDSRIQFWRSVPDRVAKLAPFLRLDHDPYLVVDAGRLFWIQDAYTTGRRLSLTPSRPPDGFSYIRNSVKVVVDAYDGDVDVLRHRPRRPGAAGLSRRLPGTVPAARGNAGRAGRPSALPRGPVRVQVQNYAKYHMTVPQVFYNSEDLWAAAARRSTAAPRSPMEPYYVLIRLPGEERLEFLLMTPLTPAKRDNMIAWMAARADAPHYGELLVYKLPKERLVLGPAADRGPDQPGHHHLAPALALGPARLAGASAAICW